MAQQPHSPFAVCVLPEPRANAARTVSYPRYVHEILHHAGLCYADLDFTDLVDALPHLRLLVTVGDVALSAEQLDALTAWVNAGGRWIGVGGVCGAPDLFGVLPEAPSYSGFGGGGGGTLGEGYLQSVTPHRILAHVTLPLHYFNGQPVQVTDATPLAVVLDAHQRATDRAAVTHKNAGAGSCLLLAPDLTGTVVRIQQGIGITRDGVSAPDGSAPVGDSVLKSGDGSVLDWIFDRRPVPGVPGLQAFLDPIADIWRELLLRAIFDQAEAAQVRLPLLWLYPDNLPALAHLSHDTDGNEPDLGDRLLEVVGQAGIHSTWCVIMPGYDPARIQRIRAAGHELALHYDSVSEGCPWDADLFHSQWMALSALFGEQPVSNKNHYLRWEGDCELFHWCQAHGIQLDQSKGASKTGEAGYNFGTCHPYFPVDFAGNPIDVLELCTPTQDFVIFGPTLLLDPLLDAVERTHGILHLLFHPAHIAKPGVAEAILHSVKTAQARGLAWWTAAAINAWERARRQATWSAHTQTGEAHRVTFHAEAALSGATLLWLGASTGTASINGTPVATHTVTRWGFDFQSIVFDATAGSDWRLSV